MSEGWLTPEGQEFVAALARGDERAEQLQRLHEIAEGTANGVLKLAAEHYVACRVADFYGAERSAAKLHEVIGLQLRSHRAIIGKDSG